jgi:hypothetical protein
MMVAGAFFVSSVMEAAVSTKAVDPRWGWHSQIQNK